MWIVCSEACTLFIAQVRVLLPRRQALHVRGQAHPARLCPLRLRRRRPGRDGGAPGVPQGGQPDVQEPVGSPQEGEGQGDEWTEQEVTSEAAWVTSEAVWEASMASKAEQKSVKNGRNKSSREKSANLPVIHATCEMGCVKRKVGPL